MMKLVNYLEKEFAYRNENCTLIIEPAIPTIIQDQAVLRKPDALIIKDNMFCLIEMKGFHGEIIADCSRWAVWKSKEGEIIQSPGSPNPFFQAGGHRKALIEHLLKNFILDEYAPKRVKNDLTNLRDWLVEHIQSWVVTEEASKPTLQGINPNEFPSFRVLPLDKLPQALMFLRSIPLLSSNETRRFLESLSAVKTSKDEWYRSSLQDNIEHPIGLIPKITSWIDAEDRKNLLKALKYIRELELRQHRPHVIRCWDKSPHPEIRQEALLILIDWQDEKLGSILNEALQDDSQSIVDFSLEYLLINGFPETIATLLKMLQTGPQNAYPIVLRAITSSGHPDSCTIIYNFAKNTFFNKPFQKFQHYRQDYIHTIQLESTREKHKEFIALINEERRILGLTTLVINSLGELQCKESVPWLTEILFKPTSLGYGSDDYTELDLTTNYYSIFEAVCKSLGKMGITDNKVSSFLLDRLTTSPEYFQLCIIELLGNLGETIAVPLLLQYLKNHESRLYDVTVTALSKIGSDESFDALAEAYILNSDSYSGAMTGEALRRINRDWFVDLLLDQIKSSQVKNEVKRVYLQALLPSVTLRCADTLFPLLRNEKLSDLAAWNLSNLVAHERVFERAMELTWSKNPIEKASALWVLDKHFIENPNELERFESDNAHKQVRRAVAALYLQSKSKQKLFKYAKDLDEEVRDTVFSSFFDGKFFGEHLFVNDIRELSRCKVAVDEESLGIKLNNEVLIISKKNIAEATVTTDGEDTYGIYLVIKNVNKITERLLIVPARRFLGEEKSIVDELRTNLVDTSSTSILDVMDDTLNKLWSKVQDYKRKTG